VRYTPRQVIDKHEVADAWEASAKMLLARAEQIRGMNRGEWRDYFQTHKHQTERLIVLYRTEPEMRE
jgi:hypothetical protein